MTDEILLAEAHALRAKLAAAAVVIVAMDASGRARVSGSVSQLIPDGDGAAVDLLRGAAEGIDRKNGKGRGLIQVANH